MDEPRRAVDALRRLGHEGWLGHVYCHLTYNCALLKQAPTRPLNCMFLADTSNTPRA